MFSEEMGKTKKILITVGIVIFVIVILAVPFTKAVISGELVFTPTPTSTALPTATQPNAEIISIKVLSTESPRIIIPTLTSSPYPITKGKKTATPDASILTGTPGTPVATSTSLPTSTSTQTATATLSPENSGYKMILLSTKISYRTQGFFVKVQTHPKAMCKFKLSNGRQTVTGGEYLKIVPDKINGTCEFGYRFEKDQVGTWTLTVIAGNKTDLYTITVTE